MSDYSLNEDFDRYVVDTLFKNGDVKQLSIMLSNKELDPNQMDKRGYTILMEAFEKAPIAVVELLVENGADIHYINNSSELRDYIDFCFFLPNEDYYLKIAFLANNGVKLDAEKLVLFNSNESILSQLDLDKISTEYGDLITDNELYNLIPQSIKDIFFQ